MPRPVRWAALLLVVYAAAMAAQAVVVGMLAGWPAAGLVRVGIRCGLALLLGHGLWRGWKWTWWVAVPATGLLALMAVVAFAGLSGSPISVAGLFTLLIVASLGGACALLLLPESRGAF